MAFFGIGEKGPQARVGLDIGTRTIKMVQMAATAGGVQLTHIGFSATPMGAVTDGVVNNPEAIGEAIQQMVKRFGMRERKVVCSLPGRAVVIRQVSLPAGLKEKEIKVACIGEVERFLPFPLDEMEYDHEVLGEIQTGDTTQLSVLFIAAHKEAVMKRVEAIRYGGLESVEMDVDPFVSLRSVVESGLFEDQDTYTQTILMLDMGASATSVSILSAGSLRFTRIFAIGGDTLTHAIESGLEMTFLEAECLKKTKGMAYLPEGETDRQSREVHEIIRPHLESLSLEVRRSMAYYTSKYRGESVTKILLTGGTSLLRGVGKYIEDELGVPVGYANPLANIIYIGDESVEKVSARVPYLGVSVGLTLRQVPAKILARHCLRVNIEPLYEFGSTATAGGVT